MKKIPLLLATLFSLAFSASSRAAITIDVTFEPGSKWFTESYSDQVRAEFLSMMNELGALFDNTATIEIFVTDDVTDPFTYAQAGPLAFETVTIPGREGQYNTTGVWYEINLGQDPNGAEFDGFVDWNFTDEGIAVLFGDDINLMIECIRGTARHEMLHVFGMWSDIYHTSTSDFNGVQMEAFVSDAFVVDNDGNPILSDYNAATGEFTVNYALNPNMANGLNQSGLQFQSIDRNGNIELLGFSAGADWVDLSHVEVVSYIENRPGGKSDDGTILDVDINLLRGLGFSILGSGGFDYGDGDGGDGGGGDGESSEPLRDYTAEAQWSFGLASYLFNYFSFYGDWFQANAYYSFYNGYGSYYTKLTRGDIAGANFDLFAGVAGAYYHWYAAVEDFVSASSIYYTYLAYAYYYYYAEVGDVEVATAYYDALIAAALG